VQKHQTLFNFEPPVTDEEIRAASLQFVRKVSGFNKPSKPTKPHSLRPSTDSRSFQEASGSLETNAAPRNREEEAPRRGRAPREVRTD